MDATPGTPIIAIYIGDELYPTASNPVSAIQKTITAIHHGPLTCPIVSMVNVDKAKQQFVYNEGDKPLFDMATGEFIGPKDFVSIIKKDLRGGHVDQVYLSFGTGSVEAMQCMSLVNSAALAKLLAFVKTELGCDGIDLDYEGSDYSSDSPIYAVAQAAVAAGLRLTAAPYVEQQEWQAWVSEFQESVSWLNVQCYSGGAFNNPGQWLGMGTLIVAGADPENGSCTPAQMQALFSLWKYGSGSGYCSYWDGTPNTVAQAIAGGFIWSYAGTGAQSAAYIEAVKNGLTIAP